MSQNNNKKNTSFGILKRFDTAQLSKNARKVATQVLVDPYFSKMHGDANTFVFVKSDSESIAKEKNVMLFRIVSKNQIEHFYSYSLGAKVREKNINNLKNKVIDGLKEHLKPFDILT